ncbi:MAG: S26 family signal peptidase [Actinomycetota bacterium]|nr:S26 family signal peptidase [Actinomycetota bacterium]
MAGPVRGEELPWLSLVTVRGPSMVPALHPGDRLLAVQVRRLSTAGLRPGAVVLAEWSTRPGLLAIKRVVRQTSDGYWVEGDNPYGSEDSRAYGIATVRAIVLFRCWPWPPWIRATPRR